MQQISLKLNVNIKKINLMVRFSCSVTCSLKVDKDQLPFQGEVPLKNGQAPFDKKISHSFIVQNDPNKGSLSEQKKIMIVAYLNSAKGRIPAGNASINLDRLTNQPSNYLLPIQKCPDKNASIQAVLSYQVVNQFEIALGESPTIINIKKPVTPGRSKDYVSKAAMVASQIPKSNSKAIKTQSPQLIPSSQELNIRLYHSKAISPKSSVSVKRSYDEDIKDSVGDSVRDSVRDSMTYRPQIDYQLKNRNNQLQRQVKNLQRRLQGQSHDLKEAVTVRDMLQKKYRQADMELKLLKEKYEESQNNYSHFLKRSQVKDIGVKDQVRLLGDRLALAEGEKQRMMYEQNQSLSQFQERQKALRSSLKEKERQFIEEKTKLNKNIDQLMRQSQKAKAAVILLQSQKGQLEVSLASNKNKVAILDDKLNQSQAIRIQFKQQLQGQRLKREGLQQSLHEHTGLQDEKKKLRKRIADQQHQISKQIKHITSVDANLQRTTARAEQAERVLKEKTAFLKNLMRDHQALVKESQGFKRNGQERLRQIEQLKMHLNSQKAKNGSQIDELRAQNRQYYEQLTFLRSQLQAKILQISTRDLDLQHLEQACRQAGSKMILLDAQLAQLSKNTTALQLQNKSLLQQRNNSTSSISQLKASIHAERQQREKIEKHLMEQLYRKGQVIQQNQRKLDSIKLNNNSLEERILFQTNLLNQKLKQNQQQLISKRNQLNKTRDMLALLQQQRTQNLGRLDELQHSNRIKDSQIIFLKDTVARSHAEINSASGTNAKLTQQIGQLKAQKQALMEQVITLQTKIQQGQFMNKQAEVAFQQQKTKIKKQFLSFIKLINGKVIDFAVQNKEEQISKAIKTAIQTNNKEIVAKDRTLTNLQKEIQKINAKNKYLQQNLDDLDVALKEERANNQKLTQNSGQNQTQLKKQIETINHRNKQLGDEIVQLKSNHLQLNSQLANSKKQIQANLKKIVFLQKQIARANDSLQNQQNTYASSASKASQKYKSQLDSLTDKITDLTDRIRVQQDQKSALNKQLVQLKKQYEGYQRRSQGQSRKDGGQIQRLRQQVSKYINDIQHRALVQKQMRQGLQQAKKDKKSYLQTQAQLQILITDLHSKNTQAQAKIATLQQLILLHQKSQSVKQTYLDPMNQHLHTLKTNLNQYTRVSDIFESSKNKLIKMTSSKAQMVSGRFIGQSVKQMGLAFNKLKAKIIGRKDLTQGARNTFIQQMKGVDLALDRVLRGQK